jgi:hypothetical protein
LGLEQVRSNHVEVFTENRGFGGGIKIDRIEMGNRYIGKVVVKKR